MIGSSIRALAVVIPVHSHGEPIGQVVFQLHRVRNGFTRLPHIRKRAREQVGVSMLAEAKDHRSADIKCEAITLEAASRTTGDQIALKNQGPGTFCGQLRGGDQSSNP